MTDITVTGKQYTPGSGKRAQRKHQDRLTDPIKHRARQSTDPRKRLTALARFQIAPTPNYRVVPILDADKTLARSGSAVRMVYRPARQKAAPKPTVKTLRWYCPLPCQCERPS